MTQNISWSQRTKNSLKRTKNCLKGYDLSENAVWMSVPWLFLSTLSESLGSRVLLGMINLMLK